MTKTEIAMCKEIERCLNRHKLAYEKDGNYYLVKTAFGVWRVRPEHANRSRLVTIFTCFENPERVNAALFREFSFNTFSGKLNLHYFTTEKTNLWFYFDYLCSIVAAQN